MRVIKNSSYLFLLIFIRYRYLCVYLYSFNIIIIIIIITLLVLQLHYLNPGCLIFLSFAICLFSTFSLVSRISALFKV
jgi:hypothetical protein